MGYILEFRDEMEKEELMQKLHTAKKAVCDAMEAMEDADTMKERGRYRMGYRDRMENRRGMRMRDDMDDMDYRNGRYGY